MADTVCTVKYEVDSTQTNYRLVALICAIVPTSGPTGPGVTGGYNVDDPSDPMYTDLLMEFVDKGVLDGQALVGVVITGMENQVSKHIFFSCRFSTFMIVF